MVWRCMKRLRERNYQMAEERRAFMGAYSDGYHGHGRSASAQEAWPNAYGAGYNEGKADAADQGGGLGPCAATPIKPN